MWEKKRKREKDALILPLKNGTKFVEFDWKVNLHHLLVMSSWKKKLSATRREVAI